MLGRTNCQGEPFAMFSVRRLVGVAAAKRLTGIAAVAGIAAVGITSLPAPAHAWWRHGVGIGIWVPPVVVAPAPVYAPPPVYYAPPPVVYAPPPVAYVPPRRVWIPPHWEGGYWVHGHWS
jgi:hypothetical protein